MMDDRPILPYEVSPLVCRPWDPAAPEVALRVSWLIERWLPDIQVEHIGSSSVPGCAGKGIIDLQVVYPPGRLDAVKDVLARLGFQRQVSGKPFPEERPMRTGAIEHEGKIYRLHAHVICADSPEVARDRIFRDRLRADERLRDAYVARKQEILASGETKPIEYTFRKGPFIRSVIADLLEENVG